MPHSMSISVPRGNGESFLHDRAATLYAHARHRGGCNGVGSILNRRPRCLLSLDEANVSCDTHARSGAGIEMVPLGQIRGSEGRSSDFDRDFNPLQDHSRERWLSVAAARQQGKALPPVDLIQVGDVYFVRDGHHRISVARALGQQVIEARVLVWQVSGPLPWEMQATGREMALGQLLKKVRDNMMLSPRGAG